ncbi:hypothetical protein ACFVVU_07490 [Kitasatospora sp. NPDC057965]|uniref:hypothetical protein n=1 Tax=Kitasatospora sp. NPDC057965 TaxID=3346291 RepID=UPI0036DC15E5
MRMSRMRRSGRKVLLPLVMGVAALVIAWAGVPQGQSAETGRSEHVAALTDADINWT